MTRKHANINLVLMSFLKYAGLSSTYNVDDDEER
jgi:hypothetical protein